MNEKWINIEGYDGLYQISNFGQVKSLYRNKETLKSFSKNHDKGYLKVHLYQNSKEKCLFVHRLVALAFIPNPLNKPQVNHIDGNRYNNHVDNLEWITESENIKHAYENGLIARGENRSDAKLTEQDVKWIRENYTKNSKEYGVTPISLKFNISIACVSKIINKKSWKHI